MGHEPVRNRPRSTRETKGHSPELATVHADASGAKATVAILLVSGAALLGAALIAAFALHLPTLGWVGFAIVSAVVLGLGGLAPIAFERTRVSPQRPARPVDRQQRLLVVADSHCSARALCDEVYARLRDAGAVHLVVPVRVSPLHFVTDDESDEWREAEQTMVTSVELLQQRGVSTTGSVGTDKPLESMTDALGFFSGHPRAPGNTSRGGVVLAGARAADKGARTHNPARHPRRRPVLRARGSREPCLRLSASPVSQSRCWPMCRRWCTWEESTAQQASAGGPG